jgi:meso-butanediol dehydrogenase / (S,S)-butanediol dehydrogenase / diacetyl reductase
MTARFEGLSAVVTGAGSGIGRATARRLAAEGARVLGLDRDEAGLGETFVSLERVEWHALDIRSDDALAAISAFGAADILVNAAGILRRHRIADHPLEAWQDTLDVNVRAAFRLSRQFAADHVARGTPGVIVNVCSIESFVARPEHAAYTASKGAILMLTRAFAYELAPHGVRVVGVAPGVTETGMNIDLRSRENDSDALRALLPIGRFARPEEIAAVICFLASADASYMTGSVPIVDGGWHTY